jgi:molybdenum cofactor cytidylyltransferase
VISGVILAAGQSRRLGTPKQLLELGGEPVIRHVLRHAASSNLNQVVLVVGFRAVEIADAAGEWSQNIVVNPDFASGQSSSLRLGLSAVDPQAEGVLFLLGDQPQVSSDVINMIVSAFTNGEGRILMPSYRGTTSNPVLFAREYFPEIARVTGDQGARNVLAAHLDEVAIVEIDMDPPLDVDSPQDYENLKTVWPPEERL